MAKFNLKEAIAQVVSNDDTLSIDDVKKTMVSSKETFGKSLSWWMADSIIPEELTLTPEGGLLKREFEGNVYFTVKCKVTESPADFEESHVSVAASTLFSKFNEGTIESFIVNKTAQSEPQTPKWSDNKEMIKTKFSIA